MHRPIAISSSPHHSPTSMMKSKDSNVDSSPSPSAASNNASFLTGPKFKLFLLIMMVVQNSSTVLVGRYTRAGVPKDEQYSVNHLITICELGKLLLSCALEYYTTEGKLFSAIQTHILARPMDALKILVPALLYLVQNTLLYVALSNLTAPIFQVTYQGKLVTTAIVSVIMLQRSYTAQQWVCLVGLSLGVAIVVLGEKKGDSSSDDLHQNLFVGLVSVSTACFSSALAGVYFEKVLKKPGADGKGQPQPSLWMRNIQLAFFSVVIAMCQGIWENQDNDGKSYLHGFHAWVWILVFLQAGGGLLVAAVIKYADNVLKGLATGVSVVTASFFSMVFFGTPLLIQFWIGALLILASVYFFSNPIPTKATIKDTEMKGLMPK